MRLGEGPLAAGVAQHQRHAVVEEELGGQQVR